MTGIAKPGESHGPALPEDVELLDEDVLAEDELELLLALLADDVSELSDDEDIQAIAPPCPSSPMVLPPPRTHPMGTITATTSPIPTGELVIGKRCPGRVSRPSGRRRLSRAKKPSHVLPSSRIRLGPTLRELPGLTSTPSP
jgi:hypothetical protein